MAIGRFIPKLGAECRLTYRGEISEADYPILVDNAPTKIVHSPDGKDLYVLTLNRNLLHFRIGEGGAAILQEAIVDLPENHPNDVLYCPVSPLISENGRLVYLVDACSDDLQTWYRNPETGALEFLELDHQNGEEFPDQVFSQVEKIRYSNDKRNIFAANVNGLVVIDTTVDVVIDAVNGPSVFAGEESRLILNITNLGKATAHHLQVAGELAGFEVSGASIQVDKGTCVLEADSVQCSIPRLAAGESIEVAIVATANQIGHASLSLISQQDELDINIANGQSHFEYEVIESPEDQVVDDVDENRGGAAINLVSLIVLLLIGFGRRLVR